MSQCGDQLIETKSKAPPAQRAASLLAGISGGVSGFFGLSALPLELPVTTTLMLRSIADIARHNGEDLTTLEARLACVEVFALGSPRAGRRTDFGYYASRALLGRLAADAGALLVERGAANLSAPVVGSLVSEIATRFSVVVSERSAASALPVLGAVGGQPSICCSLIISSGSRAGISSSDGWNGNMAQVSCAGFMTNTRRAADMCRSASRGQRPCQPPQELAR